jgi:ATP phosphoribosyltransferase
VTARVAVPSRGRLRDDVVALLERAGYRTSALRGTGARVPTDSLEFIEMRPRDAAAWLAATRVEGAFISTDIVLEEGLGHLPSLGLRVTRSELVVASRDDDGRQGIEDLEGAVVATHMPKVTADWFGARGIAIKIVAMGGALEGVCAAGLADAIVDLRETGTSLSQNRLRVLGSISQCEALFVHNNDERLGALLLRLQAALDARQERYVMLHIPREQLDELAAVFPGLAAPTVLPLAGRDDLVAVHFVVEAALFWARLGEIRAAGASGIVSVTPDALLR